MIRKFIKKYLFIHGIGVLFNEYSLLREQTERCAFLAREFGIDYLDILEARIAAS